MAFAETSVDALAVLSFRSSGGAGQKASIVALNQFPMDDSLLTPLMRRFDSVSFELSDGSHSVTVVEIVGDSVTLRVASRPQEFMLMNGMYKLVDVDYDGMADVKIGVVQVSNSGVVLMIEILKKTIEISPFVQDSAEVLREEVVQSDARQEIVVPVRKEFPSISSRDISTEESGGSYYGRVIVVLVVLIFAVFLVLFSRRIFVKNRILRKGRTKIVSVGRRVKRSRKVSAQKRF